MFRIGDHTDNVAAVDFSLLEPIVIMVFSYHTCNLAILFKAALLVRFFIGGRKGLGGSQLILLSLYRNVIYAMQSE